MNITQARQLPIGRQATSIVLVLAVIGFANLLATNPSTADNWSQWRGNDLRSISKEMAAPIKFDKETNMLWRLPMPGPAGSSPIVWEDRIFVTSAETDSEAEGESLVLICVGTDGKQKWKQTLEGQDRRGRMDNSNSASPSPSTDGEHVWCMMGDGKVYCFTVEGRPVWKKDLQATYGKFNIQFGMSTTPILDKGKLYFALMHGEMRDSKTTSEGQVIALDAKTGDQIWMQIRKTDGVAENKHSYASPTIYRDKEREFLITHGADYVIGHSLEDGTELWRCGGLNPKGEGYNKYLRFVSSPGCGDGLIVVPTAKKRSIIGLKVDLQGNVTEDESSFHWKREKGTPDVSTPLIYKDLVFLAGEKGDLSCLDAKSGELKYRERLMADRQRATPVAVSDHVYIAARDGTVYVIKATNELEVVSENKLDEQLTASPAISNGIVYVRTFDALYAFGDAAGGQPQENSPSANADDVTNDTRYAIVIHGGAGSSAKGVPQARVDRRLASLQAALEKGTEILESGGSSLDAVESVIQILEDDPQFNAGKGAVFNAKGSHELDASIMFGKDKSCGAVAGVSNVKNPIKLARLVMTETRHVLLAGQGAETFAVQQKVDLVEPTYFDTEGARKSWLRYMQREEKLNSLEPAKSPKGSMLEPTALTSRLADNAKSTARSFEPHWNIGTVGCVALDADGNIAAGTSTGGMTFKKFGRVGDSPVVGAGTYADNATCGVSATGIGEQYIRNAVAYDVSAQMKYKGVSLQSALDDNLNNRLNKNDGGLIAVDRDGNIAMGFNTSGMARAAADSNGRFEILWGEHKISERSK